MINASATSVLNQEASQSVRQTDPVSPPDRDGTARKAAEAAYGHENAPSDKAEDSRPAPDEAKPVEAGPAERAEKTVTPANSNAPLDEAGLPRGTENETRSLTFRFENTRTSLGFTVQQMTEEHGGKTVYGVADKLPAREGAIVYSRIQRTSSGGAFITNVPVHGGAITLSMLA